MELVELGIKLSSLNFQVPLVAMCIQAYILSISVAYFFSTKNLFSFSVGPICMYFEYEERVMHLEPAVITDPVRPQVRKSQHSTCETFVPASTF